MSKTILVTGATDGIGLLTAKKLAGDGHLVLLHGRSAAKLAQAQADVGGQTETYVADLSKLSEVEAMAESILAAHTHLDVVINNAGVLKAPNLETDSGRDIRFEVNTVAPFLLTQRLLPIIPATGRVVNVSSAAQAPVQTDALKSFRQMDDMDAYAQSKLALTIWTFDLAKTLPNGPAVVAVNPGSLLASKMVKDGFGIAGSDLNIGADVLVRAAVSDDFAGATGRYFDNDTGRFTSPNEAALDPGHVRKVMETLQALIS